MDRSDLTGFAALLGESLSSRVDLLERLLRGSHYPSLGQYKERLLAETIRGFLPTTVEVGTGFVMFPHADDDPVGGSELHDPLNQSAYSISRQCDILVFDTARYPPIFRDGNFVVIRPEAVRAVIEVKGALTLKEVRSTLSSFHDFGSKWRTTQLFYLEHGQDTSPAPGLFLMAWKVAIKKDGRPVTTPTGVRNAISSFYERAVSPADVDGYPFLSQLFIHEECEISATHALDVGSPGTYAFGWHVMDGRFVRVDSSGNLFRDRDRTIASLLAALHWHVGRQDFNRFFSYADELRGREFLPYPHFGTKWTWSPLDVEQARNLTATVPRGSPAGK